MMAKLNFQQPLLQSSVSCDPLKIILICWFVVPEAFLIIINYIENSYVIIFVETVINVTIKALKKLAFCLNLFRFICLNLFHLIYFISKR